MSSNKYKKPKITTKTRNHSSQLHDYMSQNKPNKQTVEDKYFKDDKF